MLFTKLSFSFILEAMPAIKQAIVMSLTVVFAYVFLQTPELSGYSLQFFALLCIFYWFLQKKQGKQLFYLFKDQGSSNILILNLAFLILIGNTQGLASAFFALTFIQLFFVALALENRLAILLSIELILFYLGLALNRYGLILSNSMSMTELSNLMAIPVVTIFYLFGKVQYQRLHYHSLLLDSEKQEKFKAQANDKAVAVFINNLIDRRLPMLEYLLTFPHKNMVTIHAEMKSLKEDLNRLMREIDHRTLKDKVSKEEESLLEEALLEEEAEILIKAIDDET
jgi:signal transduction histidine kinase